MKQNMYGTRYRNSITQTTSWISSKQTENVCYSCSRSDWKFRNKSKSSTKTGDYMKILFAENYSWIKLVIT